VCGCTLAEGQGQCRHVAAPYSIQGLQLILHLCIARSQLPKMSDQDAANSTRYKWLPVVYNNECNFYLAFGESVDNSSA
jgi:hypothetical protein